MRTFPWNAIPIHSCKNSFSVDSKSVVHRIHCITNNAPVTVPRIVDINQFSETKYNGCCAVPAQSCAHNTVYTRFTSPMKFTSLLRNSEYLIPIKFRSNYFQILIPNFLLFSKKWIPIQFLITIYPTQITLFSLWLVDTSLFRHDTIQPKAIDLQIPIQIQQIPINSK